MSCSLQVPVVAFNEDSLNVDICYRQACNISWSLNCKPLCHMKLFNNNHIRILQLKNISIVNTLLRLHDDLIIHDHQCSKFIYSRSRYCDLEYCLFTIWSYVNHGIYKYNRFGIYCLKRYSLCQLYHGHVIRQYNFLVHKNLFHIIK